MSAGTIFVLCLALGFVVFVIYLSRLSRIQKQQDAVAIRRSAEQATAEGQTEKPPLKRAS